MDPSLEFVITFEDITNSSFGEKGTLPSFLELQLLWFILKRLFNLSRRLLTILIGFTGK